MNKSKRNNFNAIFKARIGCEALRENKAINELASEYSVHPTQINSWKKKIVAESASLFERKNKKSNTNDIDINELQRIIGEQAVQLAWYKKKLGTFN